LKKRDLEKALGNLRWFFLRSGGGHDIWSNGKRTVSVPRHKEINEITAQKILRVAKK
jgi:mRNA interferase HicA